MRNVVIFALIAGLFSSSVAARQAARGNAAGQSGVKACPMIPKDLALKVTGAENKKIFDLPPEEEASGKGSTCNYGDIMLQIDVLSATSIDQVAKDPARARGSRPETWVPVSGVGDRAYYNTSDRNFATLMGIVGSRTYTIQIGLPFQGTAEQMKPKAITLANAVVPKLK